MTYVKTFECSEMIGHELKRNDCQNSLEAVNNWWNRENLVTKAAQFFGQIFLANKYWLALKKQLI